MPHVEDNGGCAVWRDGVADDGGDEVEDEVPEGLQFVAHHDVEHALFGAAADHSADRRFRPVALLVAYEGTSVEQLAPVPLFGGVGDRGAERFPDFVPWDADVGEAVVFGVGVGPLGFAVGAEASDVRRCKMFGDVADVEVGEACDAVFGSVGGPSVRAREGLGD